MATFNHSIICIQVFPPEIVLDFIIIFIVASLNKSMIDDKFLGIIVVITDNDHEHVLTKFLKHTFFFFHGNL